MCLREFKHCLPVRPLICILDSSSWGCQVDVDLLNEGDVVKVARAGRVPVDGVVIKGSSSVVCHLLQFIMKVIFVSTVSAHNSHVWHAGRKHDHW